MRLWAVSRRRNRRSTQDARGINSGETGSGKKQNNTLQYCGTNNSRCRIGDSTTTSYQQYQAPQLPKRVRTTSRNETTRADYSTAPAPPLRGSMYDKSRRRPTKDRAIFFFIHADGNLCRAPSCTTTPLFTIRTIKTPLMEKNKITSFEQVLGLILSLRQGTARAPCRSRRSHLIPKYTSTTTVHYRAPGGHGWVVLW